MTSNILKLILVSNQTFQDKKVKTKILKCWKRKAFKVKWKAFFIIFKGISGATNCVRPETTPLILKQIFWKTKTFPQDFSKSFLVESTKIENATFPYKTTLSEANVKTYRMGSIKWIYHKKWSFASNYFNFLKILFQFKNIV